MKKSAPIVGALLFGTWLPLASVFADPKSDLVEKYYRNFQDTDGTRAIFVGVHFREEVAISDREEIMACILDRGTQDPLNGNAVATMLNSLEIQGRKKTWSTHLESAVLAQTKHKDPSVREILVGTLAAYDKAKYRSLILSFLDDPNPNVQYGAVGAVALWPDAKSILSGYIQRHTANPNNPIDPVARAQKSLAN